MLRAERKSPALLQLCGLFDEEIGSVNSTNGHVRLGHSKPQRRGLTPVLHRLVEPTLENGQNNGHRGTSASCHCTTWRFYSSYPTSQVRISPIRSLGLSNIRRPAHGNVKRSQSLHRRASHMGGLRNQRQSGNEREVVNFFLETSRFHKSYFGFRFCHCPYRQRGTPLAAAAHHRIWFHAARLCEARTRA